MAIDLQLVYLPDSHDNTLKCQQVMKSSYIHHTTERWHHLHRIQLSEHIYMYIIVSAQLSTDTLNSYFISILTSLSVFHYLLVAAYTRWNI